MLQTMKVTVDAIGMQQDVKDAHYLEDDNCGSLRPHTLS